LKDFTTAGLQRLLRLIAATYPRPRGAASAAIFAARQVGAGEVCISSSRRMTHMTETIFSIVVVMMMFGFLLALPNFCLTVFVKKSLRFKLINLAIFLAYLVPLMAPFVGWEGLFRSFGLFVTPVAIISHFIFLIFTWHKLRLDRAWRMVKFIASLFVMTVICTTVWQDVVAEYLYDNTDDNMMGFIHPFYLDGWIGQGKFPVTAVPQVVHGRSMSEPDEIKEGWSIPKLWCLWFSFVAVSLIISIVFARVPWIPRRQLKTDYEHAHNAT
jgi:hypothetical protein